MSSMSTAKRHCAGLAGDPKLRRRGVVVAAAAAWFVTAQHVSPACADVIGGLVDQVSLERIEAHLTALEGPRNTGPLKKATAAYLEEQLRSFGYEVELVPSRYSDNVTAQIDGSRTPHKVFIVGAHYDSVRDSPGADDNASGVAGLLEIARVLSGVDVGASIRFIAFADEEEGLVGSRAYADLSRAALEDIIGMFSLEMIGYTCSTPGCQFVLPSIRDCFEVSVKEPGKGEFIGVVANQYSEGLLDHFLTAAQLYVPDLEVGWGLVRGAGACVPDTQRSDHSPFWIRGYRALMITDTANFRNPNYHQPTDTVATLNLPFLRRVTQASLATALRVVALTADLDLTPTRTARPTATPTPEPTPLPSSARLEAFLGFPDHLLSVVDMESGAVTATLDVDGSPRGLAVTRDGAHLYFACGSPSNSMRVLDIATNTIDATIPVGEDPWGLVLSPDERIAYVADQGASPGHAQLNVIDTSTQSVVDVIPVGRRVSGFAVSQDGRAAYVSDPEDDVVHVVDLAEGRVVTSIPFDLRVGSRPGRSVITPDGGTLYVIDPSPAFFVVIDTATNSVIDSFPTYYPPTNIVLAADGSHLYGINCCSGGEPQYLVAIDTNINAVAGTFPLSLPSGVRGDRVFLMPDGRSALIASYPGALYLMALETGEIGRSIPLASSPADVVVAWVPNPGPPTSPTPKPTRTPEPTSTPCALACAGDCQLDGQVTVDEVVFIMNVALGVADLGLCSAADIDADCKVTVDEVVSAVANALGGCTQRFNGARGCRTCF